MTGTLVVEMMDAKTGSTVWRGVASRDIDADAKPEERGRNVNKAAARLFKHFPPKP